MVALESNLGSPPMCTDYQRHRSLVGALLDVPPSISNKSRRKNNNKRSNSSVKKKRSSRQMKNKNVKKKINIPVQQVEKEGPRVIQLNDDSKTESNHGVKLDGKDNTNVASSGPVEQGGDGSTPKHIKIGSIEQCSGLNTLDDDLVFSEEDLIFIDESAEQHRFDVRDTDDQILQ
ncbi:Uncharacterized protein Fot_16059 [Forsythia ovata]|uniref:Uncharacterized protein n=1 Tax=Forsythia ovata TaxID=205694 RepID=A0ABD1WAY3_9LAMI